MKKKLIELDILRTFAILIIYFHHVSGYSFNFWDLRWMGISVDLSFFHENFFGFFGLGLFIFLSGYAIQYSSKLKIIGDVLIFWKKRIVRIMPLYLLGLFVFMKVVKTLSLKGMIIHMFGLQILLSPRWVIPIPTLWYIGLILVYYFIYMWLALGVKNNKQFIVYSCGIYLLMFFVHVVFNLMEYRFFLYYFVFMFGVLFCKYDEQIDKTKYLCYSMVLLILLIFSVTNVVLFKIPKEITISTILLHLNTNLMLTTFSILMLLFTRLYVLRLKYISIKAMQFIAYTSYVMYLIHKPVWIILLKFYSPESVLGMVLYTIIFGLLVVVLLAYIVQFSYDYVVKKFLKEI